MRLLKETFEFRTDTEADALKLIEEYRTNANSKAIRLQKQVIPVRIKNQKEKLLIPLTLSPSLLHMAALGMN